MFSVFKANLKHRESHEEKSRRKEKDFPSGVLKHCGWGGAPGWPPERGPCCFS